MNRDLTKFSQRLSRLSQYPEVLKCLRRGIEREGLRCTPAGCLANTPHPESLGSALTNSLITTDFSESLLEFITPAGTDITRLLSQMKDIHHFALSKLENEQLWPMSMPCFIDNEENIQLARYGESNAGKMKTLYRKGLKYRYGSRLQIIAGVHFNFSYPENFWDILCGEGKKKSQRQEDKRNEGYFSVIRNYYRFGWLVPYLFGASPAVCSSFLRGQTSTLPFEHVGETYYLPYATSLRLSDLGYTNGSQTSLKMNTNSLEQYLKGLTEAIRKRSNRFAKIGVKVDGEYRQLNSNILQIENELYAPIRPKRVTMEGERPSDALSRAGVEYIEVRSLDINPFSPIGIDEKQLLFLDLFLIWAGLTDSEPISSCEFRSWRSNWHKVTIEGRRPGLELEIGHHNKKLKVSEWADKIFSELREIAVIMERYRSSDCYSAVVAELSDWTTHPERTLSARTLDCIKSQGGVRPFGCSLSKHYQKIFEDYELGSFNLDSLEREVKQSLRDRDRLEKSDSIDFDAFLSDYFAYPS